MTLLEFASSAIGGLITNDRGNGCGGPGFIQESDILSAQQDPAHHVAADWLAEVVEVSEQDDPEAWQLVRQSMESQGIEGPPESVAVVACKSNGESNPHQLIIAK